MDRLNGSEIEALLWLQTLINFHFKCHVLRCVEIQAYQGQIRPSISFVN